MGLSLTEAIFGGLAIAGSAALIAGTAGAATPEVAAGDEALAGAETGAAAEASAGAAAADTTAASATGEAASSAAEIGSETAASTAPSVSAGGDPLLGADTAASNLAGSQSAATSALGTNAPIAPGTVNVNPADALANPDVTPPATSSFTSGTGEVNPSPLSQSQYGGGNLNVLNSNGQLPADATVQPNAANAHAIEAEKPATPLSKGERLAIGAGVAGGVKSAFNQAQSAPSQAPSVAASSNSEQPLPSAQLAPIGPSNNYNAIFGAKEIPPLISIPQPPVPPPIMSDQTNKTNIKNATRSLQHFLSQIRI